MSVLRIIQFIVGFFGTATAIFCASFFIFALAFNGSSITNWEFTTAPFLIILLILLLFFFIRRKWAVIGWGVLSALIFVASYEVFISIISHQFIWWLPPFVW